VRSNATAFTCAPRSGVTGATLRWAAAYPRAARSSGQLTAGSAAAPTKSRRKRAAAAVPNTVQTSKPQARIQNESPRPDMGSNTSTRPSTGRIKINKKNLPHSWLSGSTTPVPTPTRTSKAVHPIFLVRDSSDCKKSRRPASHKTPAPMTNAILRGSPVVPSVRPTPNRLQFPPPFPQIIADIKQRGGQHKAGAPGSTVHLASWFVQSGAAGVGIGGCGACHLRCARRGSLACAAGSGWRGSPKGRVGRGVAGWPPRTPGVGERRRDRSSARRLARPSRARRVPERAPPSITLTAAAPADPAGSGRRRGHG
jgi:hypothetical protein